jgi:hypothetical protein
MEEAATHHSRTAPTERREERRRLASMVSVRFSPDEEQAVRRAATARRQSVSNFIRQLVLAEVRAAQVAPLSAGTAPSTTTSMGVTMEHVEGGRLIPRSISPVIRPG